MRLAGANWLSSRFTFVIWSILGGEAPRRDRVTGGSGGGDANTTRLGVRRPKT
jgi:hypothetical protein